LKNPNYFIYTKKNKGDAEMKLSKLGEYTYLFANDLRMLHLLAKGEEFLSVHTELEDLYNLMYDLYDFACESAIAHGEEIINPSSLKETITDWNPIQSQSFTMNEIRDYVTENGNFILQGICNCGEEYEPYVQSGLDDFAKDADKIINYKFSRI
jgi:DNA-binding ferritin-like protein